MPWMSGGEGHGMRLKMRPPVGMMRLPQNAVKTERLTFGWGWGECADTNDTIFFAGHIISNALLFYISKIRPLKN